MGSWLHRFRTLAVRYERRPDIHSAFLRLGCALISFTFVERAFAFAAAWNIFGIVDLIVAPTAAVLSHAQVISVYPLALVPLFIGPPLGILTHIYSLRNLSTVARREATHRATAVAEPLAAI